MRTKTKNIVAGTQPLINPDISVDQTSAAIPLDQIYGFSVIAVSTGDAVGTLKAQVSNQEVDAATNVSTDAGWIDLPSATGSVTSESTIGFQADACYYKWLRFVYTATSGTGTFSQLNLTTKGP